MKKMLRRAALLALALGLAGSALAADADTQPALRQHAKSVFASVTLETPPAVGSVQVMTETKLPEWTHNIQQAIQKSGVFAELYSEPGADYTLKVVIRKVPVMEGWHFNIFSAMTLEMEAEWTLVATLTDAVVMKQLIKTVHSDGASAWNAVEKHQITNRGLIAKHIAEGLSALSQLKLE
ncbi:hypothetical protein [Roseateles sp. LYH14W]|uniref:SRPBCC family protein n=1 Tax=Pelomonas parva TaxID=3299032 RepID=A0ABW7F2J2_9BURK